MRFPLAVSLALGAGMVASGCQATNPQTNVRPFVGKVWVSTDPGAALGTIRIFLAEGTLVMDSCFETYRLARWERVDAHRIAWQEDTARIEADVDDSTAGELRLRLQLVQETREEHYRLAAVPFLCPDLRSARGHGEQRANAVVLRAPLR